MAPIPLAEYKALLIMSSQKSMPIAVLLISQLGDSFGNPGLLSLPPAMGYLTQILIDSVIVSIWARMMAKAERRAVRLARKAAGIHSSGQKSLEILSGLDTSQKLQVEAAHAEESKKISVTWESGATSEPNLEGGAQTETEYDRSSCPLSSSSASESALDEGEGIVCQVGGNSQEQKSSMA